MTERVLIVEDQSIEALNLQRMLKKAGYEVCGTARSVEEAKDILAKKTVDLVLLDILLKGSLTGIDLAHQLRDDKISFIYLSANSNQATLDAAKATCPDGFLVKPVREKDVLVMLEIARYKREHSLASIMNIKQKANELQSDESPKKTEAFTNGSNGINQGNFDGIFGNSPKLQEVLRHVEIVAPTETGVLILGESGTGKERIAHCVHSLSKRKAGPFIKVNCGALPANLIESLLFGHERGAFTGAFERKIGKFEQAQNGTIFLDEIGEIPPELQVKLLRVLQESEIERLGGKEVIKLNVRVIAATNRNLEKEIAEGRFRMDLYYRLNVFSLLLPPLRERNEDIPLLATKFVEKFCEKLEKPMLSISAKVHNSLMLYSWPGNIRELEHFIERCVLMATDTSLDLVELPAPRRV
ncbi:MAG TPA: sigma-54 dependent transcriptional regulator, partial [Flavisolibacter sp.]|nr:sigma-54 dependent transcriptional regulator [Flavisolibacter sp.]